MSHKIRLRKAPEDVRVTFMAHRAAYTARYRGQSVGLIFTRVDHEHRFVWCVWQDNHGHDAKGRYLRRGDAKRALLRAVIDFRNQHPEVYGAP